MEQKIHPLDQMKFASAMKNFCNVDIITLQSRLNNLQINATSNNELLNIILSDEYYKKVNDLYELVKNYDAKTLDCIMRINKDGTLNSEIDKSNICSMPMVESINQINGETVDLLTNVITKYNDILVSSLNQIYKIMLQAQELCKNDRDKIIRLRNLISKIALILVDKDLLQITCQNIVPKCPETNNQKINIIYITIILVLFVILIYMAMNLIK
jgi:hypothetical protein